ncbi:MAG: HIT domain-containing protein [Ignavibacteriota bacterium]
MERLYSPWRSKYIESFKIHAPQNEGNPCIFCSALESSDDKERLVVYRGKLAFVIMNLYPYNSGHMMVVPKRHTADFSSLTTEEQAEMNSLLQFAQKALLEMSHPHGYNLGMNLGKAGGAGVEDHLHWHIVPRWNGDTNFMPVLSDIKMVSEDMEKQWEILRTFFLANLPPKA